MGRWSGVWFGLVGLLLTLALGIPPLADAGPWVITAFGAVFFAAVLALRRAIQAGWAEDLDDFAESLIILTEALDQALHLVPIRGYDRPHWREVIPKVPWPQLSPGSSLKTWYAGEKERLTTEQQELFAILGQFEEHLHKGQVNLARRRMRSIADSWDASHFVPGFKRFFRTQVLPYYSDFLRLLAYIEIQHAARTRAGPGPASGWVRLGRRWKL